MNKENIISLKRKITNKWFETKDAMLDEILNVIDYLQHQLEEKDKIYAKIRDEIYDYLDSNRFCENFENVNNEINIRKHIFEILERGKNEI